MSHEPTNTETNSREPQLDLANLAEIAAWIATSAASGIIGNAAFSYVDSFRRRYGRRRMAELRERVNDALQQVKAQLDVEEDELRRRLERLFEERE